MRRRGSALTACLLGAACFLAPGSSSPLRGYRVIVEGRDSLSDELAVALAARGFAVRRHLRGGAPPSAALVTFSYRDVGPPAVTWFSALLADTRSGAIVAEISAPIDSLGPTRQTRARSVADSLAARLVQRPSPP